ncbi:CoA pyrophosphatase [Geobacter sp. DSM 9736]|uniref:CoA pyrophosphatase n=1 Tax=Geobacter sp. DSM 9736 TaxID=1277350 RepID=UPI000B5094DC|nr:CoA pyrophosphatase [Geobacter sp. DSM 9736]SNB47669.1 8-oxo-dGTP pyrophosphatase MutT, NUDIX family [Geobacter sp. DSM 9736]
MVIPKDNIRTALAAHPRVALPPGPIPAAVLLPLFVRNNALHILFTKRTEQLNHHGGEISFPGGVCQAEDEAPLETALRETWEEVGIPAGEVEVLGCLDDVYSIHNYLVTPFIGLFSGKIRLAPNDAEIARIIEIPICHLLRPEIFRVEDRPWRGRPHPVYFYQFQGDEIWGLTASILRQFLQVVFEGRTGPVGIDMEKGSEREGACLTAS